MKYAALLLSALALVLLGWGLTGVASSLNARAVQFRLAPVAVTPLVEKDQQEQADILAALKAIGGMTTPRASAFNAQGAGLVALPAPGAPGSDGPLMPSRQVTLLIRSGTESRAVVDGRLVREGQRLNGGGRVGRIREGGITVMENNGRQTLGVPLDTLRVGTLHTPAGQAPALAVQIPRTPTAGWPAATLP